MLPQGHLIASGIVSICVGAWFRSIGCAIISFMAGTLIDLDHLIDYYASFGFTLNIKDIYRACHDVKLKKLYLILHSYEILILLWAVIFAFGLSKYWIAIAIGFTQHIFIDQITNEVNPMGYFLAYRFSKKFKKEDITHY
ncbi:MAG: hypothetical protein JXB40_03640 [Candidatus Omnitrophica bacterium]|nr:hypothetical protein [Candidatus Omnitrophota bacterium]